MKKLLFIIFTFLITNNAYSQIIEFNKCYASQYYKSFSEEKLKKRYFTIDTTNGLITRVEIEKNDQKIISPSAKINYIDKETVRGEYTQEDDILIRTNEFIVNLNNYSVINNYYLSGKWEGASQREKQDPYLYQCESSSGGSSGLLDYWWAVILIIAITFFIFTQSGKRLKQIRRK